MTLSHKYRTRKATFAGAPDSSFSGIEREYFFWLPKRISRPPLYIVSMELLSKVQERTNLNSIVIGTPPSLDISDFTLSGIGEVVSLACTSLDE
jgi:hypothetical protein